MKETSKMKALDILVNASTGERLGQIAAKNAEFAKTDREYSKAAKKMDQLDLSKEQRRVIIEMNDAFAAQSSIYAEIAYRQGIIDALDLLEQARKEKAKAKES